MKEKMKVIFENWKYLGFSQDEVEQFEENIAKENIKLLHTVLWTTVLIITVLLGLLILTMHISPNTEESVRRSCMVLVLTLFAILVQIKQNSWLQKNIGRYEIKRISRFTTSLYLIVIDLTAILIEVVFYPQAYSTIICGFLLVSQLLFISYPLDNLIYITCFAGFFVIIDVIFKKPEIFIYDLLDSLPFFILGIVLEWRNAHLRFEILIHTEREKQLERENMERKLKESRINIMLSQIQPHFLYNTLGGISELCHSDSEKAEQAITEFASFLRENLSIINNQKIVPFEQELSHVKHYLYCEKIRYDERLNIIFRIQTTDFSVPTLSVQPIVENAVRYGVSKKEEGGTIIIESRESTNAWEIIVSDDGEGFTERESALDDEREHVGIANVRSRIMQQCGGSLEIESTKDSGTTVTIKIPKNQI